MDKSINTIVSYYDNATDTNGKTISLAAWLQGIPEFNSLVDRIRAESDKAKRTELKKQLPAITPSGLFSQRSEAGLLSHSGFICLDFDDIEPQKAKSILNNVSNVMYAGLSASGSGIFALIPISEPSNHKRHFQALVNDFTHLGLKADKSCSNISRLRFYSYDLEPVINLESEIYTKLYTEPKPTKKPLRSHQDNSIDKLVSLIERHRIDITSCYGTWFLIGCVLAENFGEAGRNYFHRISQFHANYSHVETDKQFDVCKRRQPQNKGLGFIFSEAKHYGLLINTN
jgi:hypothetical protein